MRRQTTAETSLPMALGIPGRSASSDAARRAPRGPRRPREHARDRHGERPKARPESRRRCAPGRAGRVRPPRAAPARRAPPRATTRPRARRRPAEPARGAREPAQIAVSAAARRTRTVRSASLRLEAFARQIPRQLVERWKRRLHVGPRERFGEVARSAEAHGPGRGPSTPRRASPAPRVDELPRHHQERVDHVACCRRAPARRGRAPAPRRWSAAPATPARARSGRAEHARDLEAPLAQAGGTRASSSSSPMSPSARCRSARRRRSDSVG